MRSLFQRPSGQGNGRSKNSSGKKGSVLSDDDSNEGVADIKTETERSTLSEVSNQKPLEREIWFHGMLPRDDINQLLQKDGDFVVRQTEVKKNTHLVITVRWKREVRHFVVRQTRENHFYIEKSMFESVADLVRFYIATKQPLTVSSGVLLCNGVPKQEWEVHHDQIKLGNQLGKGAFGEVYQATLTMRGKAIDVAVKTCHSKELPQAEKLAFLKEARLMRQYAHPNIVRLVGVAAQQEPLMLIMELVSGGTLIKHLKSHGPLLPVKERVRLSTEAARGMEYLEGKKCIHRDLAARNCLLGAEGEVKITDFGLSDNATYLAKKESTLRVPIKWLAVEVLTSQNYSHKSDVWSYGILLYEIFSSGKEPYPGMTNANVKAEVPKGYRMEAPKETPPKIVELMGRCWLPDPNARPPFTSIRIQLEKIK